MNRDQINRTDMQSTVASYMDKNSAIYQHVKAMVDAIVELKANNAGITDKLAKQQMPIDGAAHEKVQVRLDFEAKIIEIADQIFALADTNHDLNLLAQSKLELSNLDKLDVDLLEETGKRIAALATANLVALADYDIDQADVTDLNTLTTKFHGVKNAVRTAISGRSGETKTIPQLIGANTSLLRRRVDKMMTKFKKTNPEFYAGYLSARVIVDRGGRPSAPKAPVVPA